MNLQIYILFHQPSFPKTDRISNWIFTEYGNQKIMKNHTFTAYLCTKVWNMANTFLAQFTT